jgi:hypothetical protein
MIQRIQTVYLFLVFALMLLLSWLLLSSSQVLVVVDAGIVAALALVSIFLFKARKLQIKFGYIILSLLVLACVLFAVNSEFSFGFAFFSSCTNYIFFVPLVAGIFDYLAIRGIKKDEKLIRSLDRLR